MDDLVFIAPPELSRVHRRAVGAEESKFNLNTTHMKLSQNGVSLSIQLPALSFNIKIVDRLLEITWPRYLTELTSRNFSPNKVKSGRSTPLSSWP